MGKSERMGIKGKKREAKHVSDTKMENYLLMTTCMIISLTGLIYRIFMLGKFILQTVMIYSDWMYKNKIK